MDSQMQPYGFFIVYLGMGTIHNLYSKVKQIDMEQIIFESVDQTKGAIPDLNKADLQQGLLATSEAIQPDYYFDSYAKEKFEMNPLPGYGVPDLKLTGSFYEGLVTSVDKTSFTTLSTDGKASMLEEKYSKDIYGLTKDAKTAYSIGVLKPVLNQNLRNAMGL